VERRALVAQRTPAFPGALLARAEAAEVFGGLGADAGKELHLDAAGVLVADAHVEEDARVALAARCLERYHLALGLVVSTHQELPGAPTHIARQRDPRQPFAEVKGPGLADLEQLEFEDEQRARLDELSALAVAVGKLAGHIELPLVALLHELHRLRPPTDDLIRCKGCRAPALVRRVKLLARHDSTAVVALARRVHERGLCVVLVARLEHLVLQATLEHDDARLLCVVLHEQLALDIRALRDAENLAPHAYRQSRAQRGPLSPLRARHLS